MSDSKTGHHSDLNDTDIPPPRSPPHEKSSITEDPSTWTPQELRKLAGKMRSSYLVTSHKWRNSFGLTRKYRKCFRGDEACLWLSVELGYGVDVAELGNAMIDIGLFSHVHGNHRFKDRCYFYRFVDDGGSSGRKAEALQHISDQDQEKTNEEITLAQPHTGSVERLKLVDLFDRRFRHQNVRFENLEKKVYILRLALAVLCLLLCMDSLNLHGLWRIIVAVVVVVITERWLPSVSSSDEDTADISSLRAEYIANTREAKITQQSDPSARSHVQTHNAHRLEEMRSALQNFDNFDSNMFSDAYLLSVMDQGASNGKGKRTFNYALNKLEKMLAWRKEFGCETLPRDEKHLTADFPVLRKIVEEEGYLYWYGFDKASHPVLWVKPSQKDWSRSDDVGIRQDMLYHALLFDLGIRHMLSDAKTRFTIIADCSKLSSQHINITMMKTLIKMMTTGYPDRLENVIVMPTPLLARSFFLMLKPFLPGSLLRKIILVSKSDAVNQLHGFVDFGMFPPNLGGTADHSSGCSLGTMVRSQREKKLKMAASSLTNRVD